MSAFVFVYLV